MPTGIPFTPSNDDFNCIIDLWNNKVKIKEIAEMFNVSESFMSGWLNRKGYNRRNSAQGDLTTPMFKELTEHSEYWIGMLAADGNIAYNRPVVTLGLHYDDKSHIEKFKKFIGSENKICLSKKKGYKGSFVLSFTSSELIGILKKYGIKERKSHTMKLSGDILNSRHFWRGAFDGDGCISSYKYTWKDGINFSIYPQINFCGNFDTVNKFKNFLNNNNVNTNAKIINRTENLSVISASKKKSVDILNLLYDDCSIYLNRKYEKAMEFLH